MDTFHSLLTNEDPEECANIKNYELSVFQIYLLAGILFYSKHMFVSENNYTKVSGYVFLLSAICP